MELFKLFGTIAINNDEANEAIDDTTNKGEQAESKLSSAFKKIGAVVATAFAVDKIVGFGKEVVGVAAEVSAEISAFEQIMGDYSEEAAAKVSKIADATGMVDSRLTPYMTSMTAKFKGLGYDVDDATDFAARGLNLAADAAAFWDKSLDESTSHLNSFINGSYEGGEAIGLFANDTQMAMFAVEQGLIADTKAWSELDEATKQATRLEYAESMFKQSGATGQAAKEADQYANVQANLTEKWRQFKAQIGEPILQNIVLPAMEKLSGLVDFASEKFQVLKQWVADNRDTFEKLASIVKDAADKFKEFIGWLNSGSTGAEVLKAVIVGLSAAFVAYKTYTLALIAAQKAQVLWTKTVAAAQKALNLVMNANPIGIVILAIVALVSAFIYLWNNSEAFREFWINLWEKIKEAISIAKEKISGWIDNIKSKIEEFRKKAEEIKNKIVQAWENLKTKTKELKDKVVSWFTELRNKMVEKITNARQKVQETFEKIRSTIQEKITNAKNKVVSIFTSIRDNIREKIENARSKVSTAVEKIKTFLSFSGLKKKVKDLFDDIKEKITSPINKAKELVDKAVKKMKDLFPIKLGKIFSGIKLPHFRISGGEAPWGIGGKGTRPSVGIDWYFKAMDNPMILKKPTIFGMNGNGDLMGGGEAGDEWIGGQNTILGMIQAAVASQNAAMIERLETLISILAEYFPELLAAANKNIVLDDGTLVGKMLPGIDSRLGELNRLRERGR